MRHPVERRAPRPSRRVHAYRAVENLYAENLRAENRARKMDRGPNRSSREAANPVEQDALDSSPGGAFEK